VIGIWSIRWTRFGCVGVTALGLLACIVGWVAWMRGSPSYAPGSGDVLGLRMRAALGVSLKDWQNETGGNLITIAAQSDQADVIRYLVSQGIDPDDRGGRQQTPLETAISFHCPSSIPALVEAGADLGGVVEQAVAGGDVEITRVLLDAGADPSVSGSECYPLVELAVLNRHLDVAKLLLEHGADPDACRPRNVTALITTIEQADPQAAEMLLEHGADPNKNPPDYYTPLFYAVMERQTDVVGVLLDHGADPNFLGITPVTPLSVAAEADDLADAQLLLEHGADPDAISTSVMYGHRITATPLGDARSQEIADLLRSHGATKKLHLRDPELTPPPARGNQPTPEQREAQPGGGTQHRPGRADRPA